MIDLDEMKRDMEAGTPGPWSIPGQPDKVCCDGYTRNGWAKVVATTASPAWMQGGEPFANARRIARVFDMEAMILAQAATIEALRARVEKADELAERAYHVVQSEYTNTRHLEGAKAYYAANMQALAAYRATEGAKP